MAGDDENTLGYDEEFDEDDDGGQNAPIADGETQSDAQEPNTRFVTNILYENSGSVYGLEVLIFDTSEKIESIVVTDGKSFDALSEYVKKLSDAYPPYTESDATNLSLMESERAKIGTLKSDGSVYTYENDYLAFLEDLAWSKLQRLGSLENILKNEVQTVTNADGSISKEYPVKINATSFMDMGSDEFSKVGHNHNYAEINHASLDSMYGAGTDKYYGHVKVIDSLTKEHKLTGEALSAYQGKILNDKIEVLNGKNKWSSVIKVNKYLSYKVNEDLRLVVCNFKRSDYTGLKSKTGKTELYGTNTIKNKYAPSARVSTPLYRGDITLYYNVDGSIDLYNLTKIKKININAQVMWHY